MEAISIPNRSILKNLYQKFKAIRFLGTKKSQHNKIRSYWQLSNLNFALRFMRFLIIFRIS